jgi:hypothetical protein
LASPFWTSVELFAIGRWGDLVPTDRENLEGGTLRS